MSRKGHLAPDTCWDPEPPGEDPQSRPQKYVPYITLGSSLGTLIKGFRVWGLGFRV